MQKRVLAGLLALALLSLPVQAANAQKTGSSCSKLGATVISQAKKLTCVKVGPKLVWSKGVSIKKKPATKPVSTTNPPTQPILPTVSANSTLLPNATCRLPNQTDNLFRLGFPIAPVISTVSRITVAVIPFEFSDSRDFRLSDSAIETIYQNVSAYFTQLSFGRTRVEILYPSRSKDSGSIETIILSQNGSDSPLAKPFDRIDLTDYVDEVLSKSQSNWGLGQVDSVVLFSRDFRTFNYLGGQAWRGLLGNPLGQVPFSSPSGEIESLVFSSGIETVIIHELGHSLFGWIDLYDQAGGQSFAQGWGLMAAAYDGEMGVRAWERWVSGWLLDSEVRCAKSGTTHFLTYLDNAPTGSKMVVVPIDEQRAVAIEALDTGTSIRESNGSLIRCNQSQSCNSGGTKGLLAYTVDVSKLSALGVIRVPELLRFPNLIGAGRDITVEGIQISNLACTTSGCFVKVGS